MKGTYRYDKKARRYYVSIYWQSKAYRIFRYNGEPIWHEKTAIKLLNKVRAEIDDRTFDIRAYIPESPLTLKAFSETWLNASNACDNTKRVYRSCIKKAIEYFGPETDIRTITHSKLCLLYKDLPYSVKGKYNVLTTLKSMLNFAVKDGIIKILPPFPALSIGLPEEIQYLNYEEQQKVLNAIPERHRAIFEFAMEYGLRIGEVMALKKDCLKNNEIIIKRSFSNNRLREATKTGKIRVYSITTKAKSVLDKTATSFSDFVFTVNGRDNYTARGLNKIWREACNISGIKIELYNAIRHSLGCQLLDEGQPLELVRDVLGHTSTNITRRYAKRNPAQIQNALENRGKVVNFKREISGG
jgi:integrase